MLLAPYNNGALVQFQKVILKNYQKNNVGLMSEYY